MPAGPQPTIDATTTSVGAHLVTQRRGYTHHGIHVGGGKVVHYAGFARGWRRGPVCETTLEAFAAGHAVWVQPEPAARFTGDAALQRACSRLGEDRYSLTRNNCEHFCAWCLHGESRSPQVDRWTARLRAAPDGACRRRTPPEGRPA